MTSPGDGSDLSGSEPPSPESGPPPDRGIPPSESYLPPGSYSPPGGGYSPPPGGYPPPGGGYSPPPGGYPPAGGSGPQGGLPPYPSYPTSAPGSYGAPGGYGGPTGPKRTNPFSVASLVLAIFSIIPVLGLLFAILAWVFGFTAISQINKSGETQGGKALALAGVIIPAVLTVAWIILLATGHHFHRFHRG